MKKILVVLILFGMIVGYVVVGAQAENTSPVRYDGVYAVYDHRYDYLFAIRFFNDGSVISTSYQKNRKPNEDTLVAENYSDCLGKYVKTNNGVIAQFSKPDSSVHYLVCQFENDMMTYDLYYNDRDYYTTGFNRIFVTWDEMNSSEGYKSFRRKCANIRTSGNQVNEKIDIEKLLSANGVKYEDFEKTENNETTPEEKESDEITAQNVSNSQDPLPVLLDGVYCRYEYGFNSYSAFRFYSDGTVIGSAFTDKVPDEETFAVEGSFYEMGKYSAYKDNIVFSTTSKDSIATFEYEGKIDGDTLLLNYHNTYSDGIEKDLRYYFISFDRIKKSNSLASVRTRTRPLYSVQDSTTIEDENLELISYDLPGNADRRIEVSVNNHKLAIKKKTKIKANVIRVSDNAPKKSSIIWTSLDENIATVSKQGEVQGISVGTARIVCCLEDNPENKATVLIKVIEPITKLTSCEKKIIMGEGFERFWEIEISPSNATDKELIYSSNNTDCVNMLDDGTICATKKGKAKVTAESSDGSGIKTTMEVIVEPLIPLSVESVSFSSADNTYFHFTVKNECVSRTIINFVYSFKFYDYSGNVINADEFLTFKKNISIGPGKKREMRTSKFGAAQAYKTEITIHSVIFADDKDHYYDYSEGGKKYTITRK